MNPASFIHYCHPGKPFMMVNTKIIHCAPPFSMEFTKSPGVHNLYYIAVKGVIVQNLVGEVPEALASYGFQVCFWKNHLNLFIEKNT